MKPLLQVTNNEEKLNAKSQELRQVADNLDKLRGEHETLATEYRQITEEKTALAEQLRAEQELCAETEEVKRIRIQVHLQALEAFYDCI